MFRINQPVQVLITLSGQQGWLRGVVIERIERICNHQKPVFSVDEDCLICFFLGDQPRYRVSVEHNGKSYFARNVPPGNMRAT